MSNKQLHLNSEQALDMYEDIPKRWFRDKTTGDIRQEYFLGGKWKYLLDNKWKEAING